MFVQCSAGFGDVQSHRLLLVVYFGLVPVTRMYAWNMYHWPGCSFLISLMTVEGSVYRPF